MRTSSHSTQSSSDRLLPTIAAFLTGFALTTQAQWLEQERTPSLVLGADLNPAKLVPVTADEQEKVPRQSVGLERVAADREIDLPTSNLVSARLEEGRSPSLQTWRMEHGTRIEIDSDYGGNHLIEVSDDLETWKPLGQAALTETGRYEFLDSEGTGAMGRFYRAIYDANVPKDHKVELGALGDDRPNEIRFVPRLDAEALPASLSLDAKTSGGTQTRGQLANYFTTGTSTPGAMMSNSRVFVIFNGNLHERRWNGSVWIWSNHGHPTGLELTPKFAPGGAIAGSKLFTIDQHGALWERRLLGTSWSWESHGYPGGANAISSGMSEILQGRYLFVIASGYLWERDLLTDTWKQHPKAYTAAPFTPRGLSNDIPLILGTNHVFTVGNNGNVYERYHNGSAWTWVKHKKPSGSKMGIIRIGAVMHNKFFAITNGGNFMQRYWSSGSGWAWHNHGNLGSNLNIGTPQTMNNGKLHVTVRLHFGTVIVARVKELYYNGSQWIWADHGYPYGVSNLSDIGASMPGKTFVSRVNDNRVIERVWVGGSSGWVWHSHGIPN